MKQPLTRRQRQILDFYQQYAEAHQISPTLEEVAQQFGLNKVTIFGHVAELERKGALVRSRKGISRGLAVADAPTAGEPRSAGLAIPLVGTIAAGSPIEALEQSETLDLAEMVPQGADVYALRVSGDSMIEDGIHDGDLVLVERRTSAPTGSTVVAVLPGETGEEATLKRYYPIKNGVRLEPANSRLQPIIAPRIEIRGVVIGVIRQLAR
jgi:SOS regulatory protein LexA